MEKRESVTQVQDDGLSAKFERLLSLFNEEMHHLSSLIGDIECKVYGPRLESSEGRAGQMCVPQSLNGTYGGFYELLNKELPSLLEKLTSLKNSI